MMIYGLFNRMKKRFIQASHAENTPHSVSVEECTAEVLKMLIERGQTRFLMPPSSLCMHGGFRYGGGWHPFVETLRNGPDVLRDFYRRFRPRNLADMYFLSPISETGYNKPPWILPWVDPANLPGPIGEHGLSIEHGVSYYGPATLEKINLEHARLTRTSKAIQQNGYQPLKYGDVTGWFMACDDQVIFFIRGGKHRAAALAFTDENTPIPVRLRSDVDSWISLADLDHWPLVRSGEISAVLAEKVFRRYFEFSGKQHLP
jgi:hypothetical protein